MKSYTITVNGTAYEVTVEETGSVSAPTAAPVAAPKAAPAAAPKAVHAPAGNTGRHSRKTAPNVAYGSLQSESSPSPAPAGRRHLFIV